MDGTTVKFDLAELFRQSWAVYKKNIGPLLGATVVVCVIALVCGRVFNMILPVVGSLAASAVTGPLMLGMFKMVRQALKEEPLDFGLLFSEFSRVPDAYLAGLLIAVFSTIGAVFCVVPGIIVGTVYTCTYLFMNERKLAFWNAMEASRKMAMNNPGQWVILALALFALNLATVVTCGLGLLVTAPMTYIIIAMAYDLEQNTVIDVASAPVNSSEPPSA